MVVRRPSAEARADAALPRACACLAIGMPVLDAEATPSPGAGEICAPSRVGVILLGMNWGPRRRYPGLGRKGQTLSQGPWTACSSLRALECGTCWAAPRGRACTAQRPRAPGAAVCGVEEGGPCALPDSESRGGLLIKVKTTKVTADIHLASGRE